MSENPDMGHPAAVEMTNFWWHKDRAPFVVPFFHDS
jgi:hypothetical protein